MTRTAWFAMELMWKVMLVLALALGLSARAEPLLAPERLAQASRSERQQHGARHVLVTTGRSSMVIGEGGSVWVWGGGRGEELGTWPEYEVGSATPVRMPGMTGAISLATGPGMSHSLALMQDGTLRAWGPNYSGQLGDGTTSFRTTRVTVLGLTDVTAVAAGISHSLAVRRDGTVWAWGGNWEGTLGDGTRQGHATPAPVPGLASMVSVAAGNTYSLALRADGTVWAWGANYGGQLGDGTFQQRLTPVQVVGLKDVVAIESQSGTSYALRADGTVWAWGFNPLAGLDGGPPEYSQNTPWQVPGLSKIVSLSGGFSHALAVRQDGTVWSWGSNYAGQLGNGTWGGQGLPQPVQGMHGGVAVAAGQQHSIVLRQDGSLWTWGTNFNGVMGTGSDRRNSPVPVVGLSHVQAIASNYFHQLAVRGDGTVWSWGTDQGQVDRIVATPARVQGLTQVKAVAAGDLHSLAVRQDGTVWAWGDNSRGQLGDGTVGERRETPAPVQGLTGVVAVAAGSYHSLALKSDGTVWAWGANQYSQLGDLTLDDQPVPVQVQGLEAVASLSASRDLSVAVKQDGTVWHWGSDWSVWDWGDMMPQPAAPVDGLSEVVSVSMMAPGLLALRADGTVWQWYLGSVWDSYPAWQLDGLTDAVAVSWTANTTQLLRADGTVWNLGGNMYGERGFPTAGGYSYVLQQVPGLTGVVSLAAESATMHALRADGTLVGWGSNMYGTIGDGISPQHLEPTRVLMPCKLKGLTSSEGARAQCHGDD